MNNYDPTPDARRDFLDTHDPKGLFLLNATLAVLYFVVLAFFFPHGHPALFALLIGGQIFHMWQVMTFLYTVWDTSYIAPRDERLEPPVDVFITVAGEPTELVRETVRAALGMSYPHKTVYILNDGYVAKKDNWREIEAMAREEGALCITRTVPGGAKAGNINNAIRRTRSPLIAIFDADHVPHRDFLMKTVPYFIDETVAFVQTPQFYKNFAENYLTQGAWEQQELFFGPICKGKNRLNAATMCGTNMLIARDALVEVGGMCEESIAEDFVTGLFMHERGYTSVYHPEVLAEGLAAEDFLSYSKQQFRWARGALDVIFRYNPLFRGGLTWNQRVQYLASSSFFLSGAVVVMNAMLPILFFYTGLVPVVVSGMLLAAVFLPYIFVTLYALQRSSNFTFTFPSLALSMSAFTIHLQALWAAMTRKKSAFNVTSKEAVTGNFIRLATAHIAYIGLAAFGIIVAFAREGLSASLINNTAWALFMTAVFVPFIRSSLPQKSRGATTPVTAPTTAYAHHRG